MTQGKFDHLFSIRIDVDTSLGMREGLPRMLSIFGKHSIRANIYVVMGPDKNFGVLRRYYGWLRALNSMRHGFPRIVARSNPGVVDLLLKSGHFLAPHGWDHQRYGLMSLTPDEKRWEFGKAVAEFECIFGFKPSSYLFPCDYLDADGDSLIREFGMKYVSYNPHSFGSPDPHWKDGVFYLPVFPFYDGDMIFRRDTEEKILKTYRSYVDLCLERKCLCSVAMHPCQIGAKESLLGVVDGLLAYVREKGLTSKRIDELSEMA